MRRTTVYLDEDLHRAVRLKSAEVERSVSQIVNEALEVLLEEDRIDLEAIASRSSEPTVGYEAFLRDLRSRGRI